MTVFLEQAKSVLVALLAPSCSRLVGGRLVRGLVDSPREWPLLAGLVQSHLQGGRQSASAW